MHPRAFHFGFPHKESPHNLSTVFFIFLSSPFRSQSLAMFHVQLLLPRFSFGFFLGIGPLRPLDISPSPPLLKSWLQAMSSWAWCSCSRRSAAPRTGPSSPAGAPHGPPASRRVGESASRSSESRAPASRSRVWESNALVGVRPGVMACHGLPWLAYVELGGLQFSWWIVSLPGSAQDRFIHPGCNFSKSGRFEHGIHAHVCIFSGVTFPQTAATYNHCYEHERIGWFFPG